jgi:hypothetical protein
LLPLFSTLAFYFLWRSIKNSLRVSASTDSGHWLCSLGNSHLKQLTLASFFVALAIYSYLAARLLPLIPLLFGGLQWFIVKLQPPSIRKNNVSPVLPKKTLFLISYFLFLLPLFLSPLILYFLFNPADFVARSATVSIFNPAWNNGDLIGTAWKTFLITLGTFTGFGGDPNPLVNLPGDPAVPLLFVPFFCLGLLVSLYNIFSLLLPSSIPPLTSSCSPGG